jgi:hypothetical protein
MAEEEKENFCKFGNGVSTCTAGAKWEICAFARKHSSSSRCLDRRDLDDIVHCSCSDAQDDARDK